MTRSATTQNAVMPATVNSGDLLLAVAAFDDSTTTITTPSGWTLLIGRTTGSGAAVSGVYAKVADGTEDGTSVDFVTSNSQRGSVHVIRVTGWSGSLTRMPIVACAPPIAGGSDIVSLVLGTASADVLWIAAQVKSSTTAWGGSPPSGYANENKTNVSEDSLSSASVATATKTTTAASESTTGWWLTAGASTGTFLIAVLPVGAIKSTRPTAAIGM